tara:strand:+ start:590 stop:2071 length:1482 start_codon:yes stop_codon:yes gene_type:complete
MLTLSKILFSKLNENQIEYCHWKSNRNLHKALNGEEDLDVLLSERSVDIFHEIIFSLGFKIAVQPEREQSFSIRHYYGLDYNSGKIIHLHVSYKLITGGAILKNYYLPIEKKIFKNIEQLHGIRVPKKSIELLLLVLRKTLESASVIEAFMLYREKESVLAEIKWLLEEDIKTKDKMLSHLTKWFPNVSNDLVIKSLDQFLNNWNFISLFFLGRKLRSEMISFSIYEKRTASLKRSSIFFRKILDKIFNKNRTHSFITGGKVIAIVGSDATGKTTTVNVLSEWFGEHFNSLKIHAGLPPSNFLTFLPNFFMPIFRVLTPKFKTTEVDASIANNNKELKGLKLLVYSLRSLMIAYDRKKLLLRKRKIASKGTIVICDRYPTTDFDCMDSAQLHPNLLNIKESWFLKKIQKLETKIYNQIPFPDVVIKLFVDIDIALMRNKSRKKIGKEDDQYIRRRHMQNKKQNYPNSTVFEVNTVQSQEKTIREIKKNIWDNF